MPIKKRKGKCPPKKIPPKPHPQVKYLENSPYWVKDITTPARIIKTPIQDNEQSKILKFKKRIKTSSFERLVNLLIVEYLDNGFSERELIIAEELSKRI